MERVGELRGGGRGGAEQDGWLQFCVAQEWLLGGRRSKLGGEGREERY